MNVREIMVIAVKFVVIQLAHTNAAAIVDISFKEMLKDVKVHCTL